MPYFRTFLVALWAMASVGCAHVSEMREADQYAQKFGYERIVGQQVLGMASTLKRKAGIQEKLFLFSSPHDHNLGISRDRFGNIRIVLHRRMFAKWSVEALEGIIAHELGHILAGHGSNWSWYLEFEQQEKQTEANAWALRLSGRDQVLSFLLHYGWSKDDADREITKAEALLQDEFDLR